MGNGSNQVIGTGQRFLALDEVACDYLDMYAYFLLPILAVAGYWFWWTKLGGKGRFIDKWNESFDFREGELPHVVYNCCHAIETTTLGDAARAAMGTTLRGSYFLLCFTNQNRMILGRQETGGPPRAFEVGEVELFRSDRDFNKSFRLTNPQGIPEKIQLVGLRSGGNEIHFVTVRSGFEDIERWMRGDAIPMMTA